jgi:hypothetical protein
LFFVEVQGEPRKVAMKKNVFKCMEHGFVESLDSETLEPVETVSQCIYCGHSVAVTIFAGKVSAIVSKLTAA